MGVCVIAAMHGVKKETRSAAQAAVDASRIADLRLALAEAEAARTRGAQERKQNEQAKEEGKEGKEEGGVGSLMDDWRVAALACSERALLLCPAHYTMWNTRKEALEGRCDGAALATELRLTARCLALSPKSYCVWEHRRFCVAQHAPTNSALVAQEMALCDKFHLMDARNFHCWNYRRWLAQLGGVDNKAELEYSLRRINEGLSSVVVVVVVVFFFLSVLRFFFFADFSNYSAWHARSLAFGSFGADVEGEWQLVFNAMYTNPKDQSVWMYVFWLLGQNPTDNQIKSLADHCWQLAELDGVENSKWPLLGLLKASKAQPTLKLAMSDEEIVSTLAKIDPQRSNYYTTLVKK